RHLPRDDHAVDFARAGSRRRLPARPRLLLRTRRYRYRRAERSDRVLGDPRAQRRARRWLQQHRLGSRGERARRRDRGGRSHACPSRARSELVNRPERATVRDARLVCVVASAVVLVATVVIAGALTPHYSQLADPVSRLGSPGQPYWFVERG